MKVVKESINELREICQASFLGLADHPWAFLQIRKVSIYLTWALLHFPLTANQVSILGMIMGLFAGVLFGLNYLIAGVIVLQIAMLLDFCDGEVSRYRKQKSKEGTYLDKVYHFLVHPCIFAGITIGAYQAHPSTWIITIGFISTISIFLCPVVQYARDVALWMHCKRLVDKLNRALEKGTKGQSLISDLLSGEFGDQTLEIEMHGFPQSESYIKLKRIYLIILRYWNFPYVLFVVTITIIIQFFIPMVNIVGICFTPIELILLFYAVTCPFLIIVILLVTLSVRSIGKAYNLFVHDLCSLLKTKGDRN